MYNTDTPVCLQRSPLESLSTCAASQQEMLTSQLASLPHQCQNGNSFAMSKEYQSEQPVNVNGAMVRLNHGDFYNHTAQYNDCAQPEKCSETFDDEDVGDDEYDEEEMTLYKRACAKKHEESANVDFTSQLLQFADLVSSDIKKYFGPRKSEDGRYVDIYNDKWKSTRSGRELYYADLVKIAQGIDLDSDESKVIGGSDGTPSAKVAATGVLDKKAGVGPLAELFAFGLKDYWTDKRFTGKLKRVKKYKDDKQERTTHNDVLPMTSRPLPSSFWTEPKHVVNLDGDTHLGNSKCVKTLATSVGGSLLGSAKAPDFSDLLDSWTVDQISSCSDTPSPPNQQSRQT